MLLLVNNSHEKHITESQSRGNFGSTHVLVALWTCVTTSDFFMYIINELIISIHIKPEWNSSQALHNMGLATQAWCKGVQRWPYGGEGSREGAVGNWQELYGVQAKGSYSL